MDPTDLQERWLFLTRDTLPLRARNEQRPLREDHCFQRVLLDAVCGGRWYDHIDGRPAYRHLDETRLGRAVALADRRAHEPEADDLLRELDARSLACRGKSRGRGTGAAPPARDYTDRS